MTQQLEKLNAKQWAAQFNMTPEEYSDQVELIRRECQDEANLRLWAHIVNRYQITSAKRWEKVISGLVGRARVQGSYSEDLMLGLMRLRAHHTSRELQL